MATTPRQPSPPPCCHFRVPLKPFWGPPRPLLPLTEVGDTISTPPALTYSPSPFQGLPSSLPNLSGVPSSTPKLSPPPYQDRFADSGYGLTSGGGGEVNRKIGEPQNRDKGTQPPLSHEFLAVIVRCVVAED